MSFLSSVLILCAIVAPLAWLAIRDHRAQIAQRRALLDGCTRLFDSYAIDHDGDGFPRLAGRSGTRNLDVRLISDGMTIRRLPQLWLQVTELVPLDVDGFSILVRPSGYEFYSLSASFEHVIEVPPSFPQEIIIRGESVRSRMLLQRLAEPLVDILADPRVKEIVITRRGLRLIRQAGEGRKGEYLLLRQATFDKADVARETLADILDMLAELRRPITTPSKVLEPA